jgi:bacterioferritin-associated ferredoxin
MYICVCNGVTEREIRACAEERACSLRDLEHCLGVGAGCGRCRAAAKQLLDETQESCEASAFAVAT